MTDFLFFLAILSEGPGGPMVEEIFESGCSVFEEEDELKKIVKTNLLSLN